MTTENNQQLGFASYGVPFQEKILQALLMDHKWAQQMLEVVKLEFFEKRYLQFLVQRFFDYHKKYKCFPSLKVLIMCVREDLRVGKDTITRDTIVAYVRKIRSNPDPGDLPYVKEKALDFCRRQAMKEALDKSIDRINDGQYESVVDIMRKAIAVGTMPSVGHKFFEEVDARLTPTSRNCIATLIPELDAKHIMQGGLGHGELGVVLANTGVGKSHMLVQLGANAIRQGRDIVHYTFELSEEYTGIRYDSNLCDIPSNDCIDNKQKIKLKYQAMKKQGGRGRLIVKSYPSNSCSILTMRNHLEKLEITEGFKPELIIVDYADIMRSTRSYDAPRHEIKLIYDELRGLGMDLRVPIWTASQAHRDSAKSEVVGLENMSEAYSKAMIADFILSLSRKPLEKAKGVGRMFIAKNRFGKDGLVWPISIDTATSTIRVTSTASATLEQERAGDDAILKSALADRWNKVKEDRELNAHRAT